MSFMLNNWLIVRIADEMSEMWKPSGNHRTVFRVDYIGENIEKYMVRIAKWEIDTFHQMYIKNFINHSYIIAYREIDGSFMVSPIVWDLLISQ